MIVEVYESLSQCSITCVEQGNEVELEPDALLIHTIVGLDWEDCRLKYDEFLNNER